MKPETSMINEDKKAARETEAVWQALGDAEAQYRTYLELAKVGAFVGTTPVVSNTRYSWGHPLGIVIRS